jgi:hypothetical protein
MQPRPTLVDDFIGKSESGTRYRIYIWQHWIGEGKAGVKEAFLSSGEPLRYIDEDTYEIVRTGVRITRDRL